MVMIYEPSGLLFHESVGDSGTLFNPKFAGLTGLLVERPNYSSVPGLPGLIIPLAYKINRYRNKVGDWSATIPVDTQSIDGGPLHRQIERGWRVTIIQENNNPLFLIDERFLLYQGMVERHEVIINDAGTADLSLSGSLRTIELVNRSTQAGQSFDGPLANLIDEMIDGTNIIGSPGDSLYPTAYGTKEVKITFNDLTRYAALVKAGELTRLTLRESWDHDIPEFTPMDGPPSSGITLVNVESGDPGLEDAGRTGFGIIASTPSIRYEGDTLVNRIVPIGADEPDGDLTLASAAPTVAPYPILAGTNPDGSSYYYIEDPDSIDRYGLVELKLIRTDVKNPSDDAGTRTAAANVLYAIAVGELQKRRSENLFVEVPVANGAHIWALPGDSMRLRYTGIVEGASGRMAWEDIDKTFMVSERHDEGDPSGVRKVTFALEAPVMEYPIPDLPDAIPVGDPGSPFDPNYPDDPPQSMPPLPDPQDPGFPDIKPSPSAFEPCCPDPTVDMNDGPPLPLDEPGEPPPPPPPPPEGYSVYFWQRGASIDEGDVLLVYLRLSNDDGGIDLIGDDVDITLVGSGAVDDGHAAHHESVIKVYFVVATGPAPTLSTSSALNVNDGLEGIGVSGANTTPISTAYDDDSVGVGGTAVASVPFTDALSDSLCVGLGAGGGQSSGSNTVTSGGTVIYRSSFKFWTTDSPPSDFTCSRVITTELPTDEGYAIAACMVLGPA